MWNVKERCHFADTVIDIPFVSFGINQENKNLKHAEIGHCSTPSLPKTTDTPKRPHKNHHRSTTMARQWFSEYIKVCIFVPMHIQRPYRRHDPLRNMIMHRTVYVKKKGLPYDVDSTNSG